MIATNDTKKFDFRDTCFELLCYFNTIPSSIIFRIFLIMHFKKIIKWYFIEKIGFRIQKLLSRFNPTSRLRSESSSVIFIQIFQVKDLNKYN